MGTKPTNQKEKLVSYNAPSKRRQVLTATSYAFIFSTLLISLILLANYIYFHNRFYIQTRVGDYYVGGMTLAEAREILAGAIEDFQVNTVEVEINGEKETIDITDFNAEINANEVLQNIYTAQHPAYPDTFSEYVYSIGNNFKKYDRALSVNVKEANILNTIYANFENISPFKEPEVIHQEGRFVVVEGKSGTSLTPESVNNVKTAFEYLYRESYSLQTTQSTPTLSYGEVAVIADAANEIIEQELKFKAGNVNVTEKLADHPEWLLFDISSKTFANALFSKPIYYKFGTGIVAGEDTVPVNFSILLNPEEIDKYVNTNIVSQLDNHAEHIKLSLDANETVIVEGTLKDGYALEKEQAVELIVENFKNSIYETELPISVQEGQIYDETELNLGIKELIAYGESDFGHSTDSRETNIKVGLSRFQNVIIGPGEIFNYAQYIGPIDAAHGFMPGWVIKNRTQTALEYGGGICQTSTTLFRAAFYGGFPIVERHPHSYDVEYYRWPQPGLDASVYIPSASMQFRNDSPGHILIQQDVNTETKRARVWIYGTDDGRKVEVSGPEIYGKYWASTSYEIPSADLAPGERKLTKSAIAGFQTDYFRTVTFTDGREDKYTLHSSYVAVPATYLVGVGE